MLPTGVGVRDGVSTWNPTHLVDAHRVTILWAAAEAAGGGLSIDWAKLIGPIYSTGLVGLLVLMLIFEIGIVTKKSVDRLAESHAKELTAKDEIIASQLADLVSIKVVNSDLQKLTSEKMIPALVQATEVSRAYVTELSRRGALGPGYQPPAA